ncbi:hypothetical protein B0H16DRAFT_1535672 [Mycena metata]|uniref:Uncharacterized protein n=1 Tax=Mycena metata TaxID=1033252 RepID=A0AAD7J9Z6_9AGAR|nr:hypothetical protein B0H16DRAFT_1535672 [Mycena metata]
MSVETQLQTDDVLRRFWLRVGDLCARSRVSDGWVGSPELRKWNQENPAPCGRCALSKDHKTCTIAEDHPSCLTCRNKKLSCDRRARFVFEHTRDEFFADFDEFRRAFSLAPPKDVQNIKKTKSRTRKAALEALKGSAPSSSSVQTPRTPISLCVSCLQDFEKGKKKGKMKAPSDARPRPLHTLLSSEELQDAVQRFDSTRAEILSLRCELEDKLESFGESDSTIDQLISYTYYYESALLDHQRFIGSARST